MKVARKTAAERQEDRVLVSLWNALADPTRRAILDMLREAPRTTGALSEHFPTSRFAVMKHLNVLENAGLVVVRRRGRERWNHLNAVPLQLMYERWVKRYEGLWASKLTDLKSRIEGEGMLTDAMTSTIEQVELEIEIAASPEKVWKALMEDTTFWWPKSFYTGPKAKGFHIEPRLGGRAYEDWGNNTGVIWFQVFALNPPHSVDLQGCMAVPYGPAHTLLHLELVARGAATVLKVSDSTIGFTKGGGDGSKLAGWRELFEDGLKKYVERPSKK